MAVTLNVDQMTTDTQEFYLRTVEDQVHDRIPLIHKLKKMNHVVTKGGRYVTKPIGVGMNTQTQSYGKGENMNSARDTKRSAAKFTWRYTQTPIKYDVDDEIQNDGPEMIVDTVAAEVSAAQEDMLVALSKNFFGIYSGTTVSTTGTPANKPLSINAAFYGGETTYGGDATYGGVARTEMGDYWDGNIDDCTTLNAATYVNYNHWDFMVDKCLRYRGNRKSLLAVCGSDLYRKWKTLVRAKEGDLDLSGELAKTGFAAFSIDGVELVLDDNCPSTYFYMLDLSTWEWRISPRRNFKVTPFKWQGENNNGIDEYLARVLLAHTGLICWKPRNNYMATNMS